MSNIGPFFGVTKKETHHRIIGVPSVNKHHVSACVPPSLELSPIVLVSTHLFCFLCFRSPHPHISPYSPTNRYKRHHYIVEDTFFSRESVPYFMAPSVQLRKEPSFPCHRPRNVSFSASWRHEPQSSERLRVALRLPQRLALQNPRLAEADLPRPEESAVL